jgi:hypothetical protein
VVHPPIIGTAIIIAIEPTSNNAAGLLIAFYCTQFFLAQGNMVISLISRNIASQTKKSTCLTMTFVGKFAVKINKSPQTFPTRTSAKKRNAMLTSRFLRSSTGWAAGNMAAPQIFQARDAPRYIHGFVAHMVIYGVYVGLILVTMAILMRRNAKKEMEMLRERVLASDGVGNAVSHDLAFQNLTDRENPNFRYVF